MTRGTLAFMALAVGPLAGCSDGPKGGTDVGNGRSMVELDARGYEQPAAQTQSLTLGSGDRIDRLYVAIERIRLEPGTDCSDTEQEEIDVEGPLVADLVGQGFLGGPARFDVASGSFCELRFKFHKIEDDPPAEIPSALAGLSILVEGVRADGAPFIIASDIGDELRLQAKDEAFLLDGANEPLFLGYELSSWLAAVGLDTLGPGPIEISDSVNSDRLEPFEDAFKAAARLFKDVDDDGALTLTDQEGELALPE